MTEPVTVPFIFLSLLYVAYLTLDNLKKMSLEMVISVFVFVANYRTMDPSQLLSIQAICLDQIQLWIEFEGQHV